MCNFQRRPQLVAMDAVWMFTPNRSVLTFIVLGPAPPPESLTKDRPNQFTCFWFLFVSLCFIRSFA